MLFFKLFSEIVVVWFLSVHRESMPQGPDKLPAMQNGNVMSPGPAKSNQASAELAGKQEENIRPNKVLQSSENKKWFFSTDFFNLVLEAKQAKHLYYYCVCTLCVNQNVQFVDSLRTNGCLLTDKMSSFCSK